MFWGGNRSVEITENLKGPFSEKGFEGESCGSLEETKTEIGRYCGDLAFYPERAESFFLSNLLSV